VGSGVAVGSSVAVGTTAGAAGPDATAGAAPVRPATAGPGASLRATVTGKDVYLVLSGPGTVDVTVNGKHQDPASGTTPVEFTWRR
jgi:hypothetical protein